MSTVSKLAPMHVREAAYVRSTSPPMMRIVVPDARVSADPNHANNFNSCVAPCGVSEASTAPRPPLPVCVDLDDALTHTSADSVYDWQGRDTARSPRQ
jgi:hypothetical protein